MYNNKDFKPFNSTVKEEEEQSTAELTLTQPSDTHCTIKDMNEADRPREKLMSKGAEALTTAELLAILIGGGTTKRTAVELAQDILDDCGNKLVNLSRMTKDELMLYDGIGEARALSIIAAAEIGRRRSTESIKDIQRIMDGQDVIAYMQPKIQDLTHEQSWALLMNNDARLLKCAMISKGGITETSVDVRILFKAACLANATCFILVHNHPSGNLHPSRADEELTHRVAKAGQTMNIRMIDHVIVTDGDYYSFAENGKI